MPSPFPGMDPFLEKNPIFHELHTQMLAEAQARLQLQIRPKYVARLERHLSEGSVWSLDVESLDRKEPDLAIVAAGRDDHNILSTATWTQPTATVAEQLDPEELDLRKQRRIVIYVNQRPRLAVTSIELLSPSNKQSGSVGQERYLEKRSSALHGGLHWVEIDLLRGGRRPPIPARLATESHYQAYVARATLFGWDHQVYAWNLPDPLPNLPIPLLGDERAVLDLGACFREAYDRIAADDEADYSVAPPPPVLQSAELDWVNHILSES